MRTVGENLDDGMSDRPKFSKFEFEHLTCFCSRFHLNQTRSQFVLRVLHMLMMVTHELVEDAYA